jgi:nicotinamide phosphoribosyltransferase
MNKIFKSPILNTDSYKVGMNLMYPPNTTGVYSYIESRGGRYDQTVFFGLQAFIKEYLLEPITQSDIDLADHILTAHGEPFNRAGWEYILRTHKGFLPVIIRAVPEGTVVPVRNVLATIENTDPECYWLTTWLETALLRAIWYPTTVATQSWTIRKLILKYLEETGDPALIDFKLHDFSARGVSSIETAGIGGASHLVSFMGTDTITGMLYAREYYGAGVSGFSIPASEHSISTSYGKNEKQYVLNMIDQFAKPGSIFAMVADTFNVYEFAKMLGDDQEIKEKILAHAKTGGFVVVRPDSGDPVQVNRELIKILSERFGWTTNSKGFKVLNAVRLIQGDGVNEHTIDTILSTLATYGWSADNISFGMGGALGQMVNRDTQKFAMKASSVCIDGVWRDVQKDPITDPGKRSKAGRVTLYKNRDGSYYSGVEDWPSPAMETVFKNGELVTEYTFEEVRANSRA